MKRLIAAAALVCSLSLTATPSMATSEDYDDTQTHPLRIAAYAAYPIGFTVEWLVFRPLHYIVSRPYLDRFFGHQPHGETRAY